MIQSGYRALTTELVLAGGQAKSVQVQKDKLEVMPAYTFMK